MANNLELSFKSSEIASGTLMKGSLQRSSVQPTLALSESISNVNRDLSFCTPGNIFIWVLVRVTVLRTEYVLYLKVRTRYVLGVNSTYRYALWVKSTMMYRTRTEQPENKVVQYHSMWCTDLYRYSYRDVPSTYYTSRFQMCQ